MSHTMRAMLDSNRTDILIHLNKSNLFIPWFQLEALYTEYLSENICFNDL